MKQTCHYNYLQQKIYIHAMQPKYSNSIVADIVSYLGFHILVLNKNHNHTQNIKYMTIE